jgi:lactate dehydrogenase-like 2-hydroxyacid dehydrogenase
MSDSNVLLITENFHPETVEKLDSQFVTYKLWQYPKADQPALIKQLKPVCKAVATASWVKSPLIYTLPKLEIISCFGVGVENIDLKEAKDRKISVTNTPKVLDDAVADIAISLILAAQRNLIKADQFVRDGRWLHNSYSIGKGLAGKTLGILGLGSIGEEIALRALPLKLNVAYHNRSENKPAYQYYPTPAELAENSDILLCMLPGGRSTEKLVNREILEKLGSEGFFINVGRGSSVDEDALIEALINGTIAGAGLDVFQNEPAIRKEFLKLENVILLPHIGSATVETRIAMGQLVIKNLMAWSQSLPIPNIVN